MTTAHELSIAIFEKSVSSPSHRLQTILSQIDQYNIILYKPGLQLFMGDWLSKQNHETNSDDEILDKHITINAIESCTHTRLHDSRKHE